MALSLGISHVALPTLPSGNSTYGSVRLSAASSETWHQKQFSSLNLRVRPNSSGGGVAKGLTAEYVTNRGERSEGGFGDNAQVGRRGPPLRNAPQRSDGKLWRRFPVPQGGPQDVSVPIESLKRGAVFRGTVSSIQSFGAFVTFGAFTDGLIHISNLSADYVKDVGHVLELEQEVLVRIMKLEEASGRISLALVGKDEIEQRNPYMSPRRKDLSSGKDDRSSRASYPSPSRARESREGRERPRFQRSHSTSYGEQNRVSRAPHASSRQPEAGRRGGSRFQQGDSRRIPPFTIEEEEGSDRRSPFAMDEEGGSGRRSPFAIEEEERFGRRSRFAREAEDGSGRRSPFAMEEEEGSGRRSPFAMEEEEGSGRRSRFALEDEEGKIGRNPFASTGPGEDRRSRNSFTSSRQREAGEGGRMSGTQLASSRGRSARGEERMARNSYSSSGLREALEGDTTRNPLTSFKQRDDGDADRMSRSASVTSGPRGFREEEDSSRFQSSDDTFLSGGGVSGAGRGVDRDEQAKPRARLVQMRSDATVQEKSSEEQVIRNQSMMRSWYECDCC